MGSSFSWLSWLRREQDAQRRKPKTQGDTTQDKQRREVYETLLELGAVDPEEPRASARKRVSERQNRKRSSRILPAGGV